MPKLSDIIDGCKKGERSAQCLLYEMFSPRMRSLCFRYTKENHDADDIIHDAFLYILTHIDKYKGTGSLEGWIRRIVVGSAIKQLKTNNKLSLNHSEEELQYWVEENSRRLHSANNDETTTLNPNDFNEEEVYAVLQELPDGYRMVFNLYVFEKLSHKEIAKMLDIKEGSSKSQLNKARKTLQSKLMTIQKEKQAKKENEDYRKLLRVVI